MQYDYFHKFTIIFNLPYMKTKHYITVILFVLVVSFTSCVNSSGSKNNDCQVIDMAYELDNAQLVNLSKYASSIEYIPLETSVESMLGRVAAMAEGNSCFYLATGEGVKVFDSNGKYRGNIGSTGRGPGEVGKVSRIICEEDTKGVALVDIDKIVVYDHNDNSVLRDMDISLSGNKLGGVVGYAGNGCYELYNVVHDLNTGEGIEKAVLLSAEGKILKERVIGPQIKEMDEFKGFPVVFSRGSVLYMDDGDVYSISSTRDTLYRIYDEEKVPELIFDYGKYTPMTRLKEPGTRLTINPNTVVATEKFVLFGLGGLKSGFVSVIPDRTKQRGDGYVLYDKQEKRLYVLKHDPNHPLIGFKNDIDGGSNFVPRFSSANCMYRVENADKFIEYAAQSKSVRMKEIAATLTEESNPVLIKVVLK